MNENNDQSVSNNFFAVSFRNHDAKKKVIGSYACVMAVQLLKMLSFVGGQQSVIVEAAKDQVELHHGTRLLQLLPTHCPYHATNNCKKAKCIKMSLVKALPTFVLSRRRRYSITLFRVDTKCFE